MPELPDIELYLHALRPRILHQRLERIRITSPFLLRTVDPPIDSLEARRILGVRRLGKRIVFEMDSGCFLVLHLMIAGRLRWMARGAKIPPRIGLASFDFSSGSLALTEAGSKKRAALHAVRDESGLRGHDPGGLEPLEATAAEFAATLRRENHTLKRALTDPRLFSGIGNAYSDEILHAARMSPVSLTRRLSDDEIAALHRAAQSTLRGWTRRLIDQLGDRFPGPGDVTAFREDFAVHGRFRKPCPACGGAVQRIRYAENETNYCPGCQTRGRLLADRSLSRLLREDWPRSVDEAE